METFDGKSVADWVEKSAVSLHFIYGELMEGFPVKVKADHDQKGDCVSTGHNQVRTLARIAQVSESELGEGHCKGSRLCVCRKPISLILENNWK